MLKFEKDGISINRVKTVIRDIITQFQTTKLSKGSIVQPDVDPYWHDWSELIFSARVQEEFKSAIIQLILWILKIQVQTIENRA